MTPELFRSLRERIHREFVESAGLGVNRQVYFCLAPVCGWWRDRDRFQILPVPKAAPKADFPFLDHPFLIEFRYTRAPDFFLDSCRRARVVSKLALLLNAFLVSPVQPGQALPWEPPVRVGDDAAREGGHRAEDSLPAGRVSLRRDVQPRGGFQPRRAP